jgi:ferric-dicitrate binding protein FerR (iron transport regulator)
MSFDLDEMILRSIRGELSAHEERMLAGQRRADPAVEARYKEFEQLWRLTARKEPAAHPSRPSAFDILRAAKAQDQVRVRRWWKPIAAGAAAAAVVLLAVYQLAIPPRTGSARSAEISTGNNEMATVQLSDGTIARIAPKSRLRIDNDGDTREVWLDGQAFFGVAPSAGERFTVRTRAGVAQALGTRFDVRVEEDGMRVVVVEGRVVIRSSVGEVEIGPNEVSRVGSSRSLETERVEDVSSLLEWMEGSLVFQSTPLTDVAREVRDRYALRVEVADSALARRKVTAWFTDESAEQVLAVVCRVAAVPCAFTDSVVTIGKIER